MKLPKSEGKMNRVNSLLGPKTQDFNNNLGPRIPRSQLRTEAIADNLVKKFESPEYKPLFLKVAWRLPEDTINRHAATAQELGKNPRAYFISLVKREKDYYQAKA